MERPSHGGTPPASSTLLTGMQAAFLASGSSLTFSWPVHRPLPLSKPGFLLILGRKILTAQIPITVIHPVRDPSRAVTACLAHDVLEFP
jgi:hypothetical protein